MKRVGLLLAAMCGLTAASGSAAQTAAPQRTTTEAFAAIPEVENPKLSPGGKLIAAMVADKGRQYFTILPVDGGAPRRMALGSIDLQSWQWVNDDWLVMSVSQRVSSQGMNFVATRAYAVSAQTGAISRIGPEDAGQLGGEIIWTATDGTPRVLLVSQTATNEREDSGFWPQVFEIDVATKRSKRAYQGEIGVFDWYADGAGVVRMGIGSTDDGRRRRLMYRGSADERFRTIDRAAAGETLTVPALFLKDKDKALVISDDDDGYSALYEYDLATMTRGKQVFASKGYDIGGLVRDAGNSRNLGVWVDTDRPGFEWSDPAMVALQARITGMIKGGAPRIVSFSRDLGSAIVHVGGPDAPGALFLYRAADNSMNLLGMNNRPIGLKRLRPVRTIRYKARDGLEIAAVLTLPDTAAKNLPLIVMPHGGPRARDSEEWDWWAQFLADRGYAVIQPNYRGSVGYGTKFMQKGEGQWGLAMQDDLNDAVRALADQGIADPKRVCMVGASYGGYAALRAAQRDGKLYRCAVSYAGVSDLNRMLNQDRDFLHSGARRDWIKDQAPDLRAVSPLAHADEVSIPVLMVHGAKDVTVLPAHSREMAEKLRALKKDVTYIEQPEADHYFGRSEDRLEFLKALEAFLAKHNPA